VEPTQLPTVKPTFAPTRVHVRAQAAGVLVEVVGEVDEIVEVGSPLFRIDTDANAPEGMPPERAPVEVASVVL
jgi:pyruvate/2-oxoglutarate dehydrogenase complex dihydrolipoamide acyltransferase (E2) component